MPCTERKGKYCSSNYVHTVTVQHPQQADRQCLGWLTALNMCMVALPFSFQLVHPLCYQPSLGSFIELRLTATPDKQLFTSIKHKYVGVAKGVKSSKLPVGERYIPSVLIVSRIIIVQNVEILTPPLSPLPSSLPSLSFPLLSPPLS